MIISKKEYKVKITYFTVNAFDDGYYKDGLPVDEANRKMLVSNINRFGKVFDFKVFDYTHPLVIECKEKYKEFFNREDIINSVKTDVVRLYILSKLPYHLYVDDDVVLLKDFDIEDTEDYFFSHNGTFNVIYNGNKLDIFKEMLEVYPFDDEQLNNNLDVYEKNFFLKNINFKRYDFCLMNYYKPLIKYKKYNNCLDNVKHYYSDFFKYLFENSVRTITPKKVIIIEEEEFKNIKTNKEYYYCILTKELNKYTDIINYSENYNLFYKNFFSKEYIINKTKELFEIEEIVENNGIIEIVLKNEYSCVRNKRITCFTVNIFNNGYYKNGLPADEINKKIWLYNVEKYSEIFDFKVFDYTHPLVIECKEKYKDFFDRKDLTDNIKADVVRLYILSKLPYHLYIDDDVVILNNFLVQIYDSLENFFISDKWNFCCIYNGNRTDVAEKMLEVYPFDNDKLKKGMDYNNVLNLEKNNFKFIDNNLKESFFLKNFMLDYYLFKYYKPFKEFDKYTRNFEIIHYFNFFEKNYVLLNTYKKEIKIIHNYKNIITKNTIKPYDGIFYVVFIDKPEWHNFFDNIIYVCKDFFTEEYIIDKYKQTGLIKEIVKDENQTKLILY